MEETEEIGKPGGGGYDGLLHHLRYARTPEDRRKALEDFFDACLPITLKELPGRIHHIYMLLDPLSTLVLYRLLEDRKGDDDEEIVAAISLALSYLSSKRDTLPLQLGELPSLRTLPDTKWSTYIPPTSTSSTRRSRLRAMRAQWRQARSSPSQIVRKVRFSDGQEEDVFVTAPETFSRFSVRRTPSSESKEEWFVAPEEEGGEVELAKSVGGLIREGKLKEEATEEEPSLSL